MEEKPQYHFKPQEDITAYELSHIIKLMFCKTEQGVKMILENMPSSVNRHLLLNVNRFQ